MVDRLYKFIQTVSNNELNGNISPQEFKLLLHNSVNEITEEHLNELKNVLKRESRDGRSFSIENIPGKLREKIMHYYTEGEIVKVGTKYPLPANCRYIDTIEYNGVDAEPALNRRQFKAIMNYADTTPTLAAPVYLKIANDLELAPSTAADPLTIYYLRNPLVANWTFVVVNGVEIFNPDAADYQDVDIHPAEEYNLGVKLLQKLGVNLKEEQITEYGLRKETQDFNKDNAA